MSDGVVLTVPVDDAKVAAEAAPVSGQDLILQALCQDGARPKTLPPAIVLALPNIYHEAERPFFATARVSWDADGSEVDLSACVGHGAAGSSCTYRVAGMVEHRHAEDASAAEAELGMCGGHYVSHLWRHGSWFTADDSRIQTVEGPLISRFPYVVFLERVQQRQQAAMQEWLLPAPRPCPKAAGPDLGEELLVDMLLRMVRACRAPAQKPAGFTRQQATEKRGRMGRRFLKRHRLQFKSKKGLPPAGSLVADPTAAPALVGASAQEPLGTQDPAKRPASELVGVAGIAPHKEVTRRLVGKQTAPAVFAQGHASPAVPSSFPQAGVPVASSKTGQA